MSKSFSGEIKARVVEVKFALAGKVVSVKKFTGDRVSKGDHLASLDRKILQMELDRQLADFEKVRADFEIFNGKNPDPSEMVDRYLKTQKQASLNASVKEVEIAKSKLDQCDLISPVSGVIIDDSSIVVGINVTPASSPIKIIDYSSLYFEFEIEEKDIELFGSSKEVSIKLSGVGKEVKGNTGLVLADGKGFFVRIPIGQTEGIFPHLHGKVNF